MTFSCKCELLSSIASVCSPLILTKQGLCAFNWCIDIGTKCPIVLLYWNTKSPVRDGPLAPIRSLPENHNQWQNRKSVSSVSKWVLPNCALLNNTLKSLRMGKSNRLPCWPSRGQQVSHQRWISRNVLHICLCQVWTGLPTLALKPRGDITRSPRQGYQWPHKSACVYHIILKMSLSVVTDTTFRKIKVRTKTAN